ncbi:hypothetical protein JCM11641_002034 [Rhodosporidiobolus odoratus]
MVQSAQGLLSLLDEPEAALQSHALSLINDNLDTFWAEVADEVVKVESLSESPTFPAQSLASLVASKVYYHLGSNEEALRFALGAAKLFDVELKDDVSPSEAEYVETVVSKAIDSYISSRSAAASSTEPAPVDARLEAIVERMFERCERDGECKQALGIALSSHRLDVVRRIFSSTSDASLLDWILDIVIREGVVGGASREYKSEILHLLIELFSTTSNPDYFAISQCHVYLNDATLASALLTSLLHLGPASSTSTPESSSEPDETAILTAYQIAFDLAETATQEFLQLVRSSLAPATESALVEGEAPAPAQAKEGKEVHRERVVSILSGEESIRLQLEFLYRNNKTDMLLLKGTKDLLEPRNSIYHSAVTFLNAFSNAGTTSDLFLRENLDWLGKASNWSKFTTTAALGVIHKGNLDQGKAILEPYLPREAGGRGDSGSVYSEGGSLYALGLVNANHGREETVSYLLEQMNGSQEEVIQHGAALGLGVASMGSGNEEVYDALRTLLFNDSAVAGEAAGYSMGLVMLGTGSEKALDEMLQYAHETQHEKIIRGLALGIAFLMYGREEAADKAVEGLLGDADAILRYGGTYTLALAYAGTGNNNAIRKLLHIAVSDVSDDVRRAAVTALGFILFRNPTQVPRIVQLLAESYNPHVRYGSAMALGISCAGTGLEDAIALLEPLTKDPVDFVRQGACLSLAMILIEQSDASHPKSASTRSIYTSILKDKHADAMAKFGAALSQGVIDAGGRNVTVSMMNKGGRRDMKSIVGMALFLQFWYWFPLGHCLSLAFTPTAVIGVDRDLKIPKFDFTSNTKPSLFAYQPATKPPTEKKVEKVEAAVLSTTAKASMRQKEKDKEQGKEEDEEMETDEPKPASTSTDDAEMKVDEPASGDKDKEKEKKPRTREPSTTTLSNLSRVTPPQLAYISFPSSSRFVPIRPVNSTNGAPVGSGPASSKSLGGVGAGGGILLVRDTKTGEGEVEFMEMEVLKAIDTSGTGAAAEAVPAAEGGAAAGGEEDFASGPIAEVPPPFEWTDWE